jgi:hypothetical protein
MMKKCVTMCVVVVAVTLLLGSVSSAATIHWTGLGDDNLWSNPANFGSQKTTPRVS